MDLSDIFNFLLHLDRYLNNVIDKFGFFTYLILFLVIFAETGLVVTPFLPGDSLLFALGTLAAGGSFNIILLFAVLFLASVVGDTVNYWVGNFIGAKAFEKPDARFFKKEYLQRTERFYEKHGGKAIVLGRFIPIVRTFVPFVAGVGNMSYPRFLFFNVVGGFVWVSLFLFAGYFFGNLPLVKDNFSLAILGIVVVSILPGLYEYTKHRLRKAQN